MEKRQQVRLLLSRFKEEYGDSITTDLIYNSDWQLLFAVILSAQNTDKNVNKVTKVLFNNYPTLSDFANA